MLSSLSRYALVFTLLAYMAAILLLHVCGIFPRANLYDISRLQGASLVTIQGTVVDAPILKWGQTRFLMKGCATPMDAFCGKLMVTLPLYDWSLAPGDEIRVRGWLSKPKPNTRSYWTSRRVYAFLKVWNTDGFTYVAESTPWSLKRAAWTFQNRYREFWEERLSVKESALLLGVTVGAKGVLPPAVKEACIRAGVYHIVVVSGQNMSLLVTLGLIVLMAVAVPRRHALWICLPLITFYTAAVGGDPPVVRAAVTAVVGLFVAALGRDVPSYYPLFIAAGWILLQEPEALLGASFQLSFAATLSILLIYPLWQRIKGGLKRWGGWILEPAILGAAVYIGIWPILVAYFHRISIAGLLANWTVFPLSGLLMVLGLFIGTWGACMPQAVPEAAIQITRWLLQFTLWLIEWMAGWSWSVQSVAPPPWWVIGLYYGSLFGILLFAHRRKI